MFLLWFGLCDFVFCFFKQKTAYEMRISDWSSDVCSSDLRRDGVGICQYSRASRRGTGPKSARREAVGPGSSPAALRRLQGPPAPGCAQRLASELPGPITVIQNGRKPL